MAFDDNLQQIRDRGHHYLVAARQIERKRWEKEFEQDVGWQEMILERRVETQIFLCVLAYHLLIAIEKTFLDQGLHTSWATLRQQLSTHQVVTGVLPTTDGRRLEIRRGTTPEPQHRQIYDVLGFPYEVMAPMKAWLQLPPDDSDGKNS